MGSLFTSLSNVAGSLRVFERSLTTTQNNVANLSTPGFARQSAQLEARPFAPLEGIIGGVRDRSPASARDAYSERAVWRAASQESRFGARADALTQLEPNFNIAENSGIAGGLSRLFASFSQLAVTPNDASARQLVVDRARELAAEFNRTAAGFRVATADADTRIRATTAGINGIAARIAEFNQARRQAEPGAIDAGADAGLYTALEELSALTGFTALEAEDGTLSVYLTGQSLLVIGNRTYPVSATFSNGDVAITSAVAEGSLGALVELRNQTLPTLIDGLNTLAAAVADRVNTQLAAGLDQAGSPPATPLFVYTAADGAAATLGINSLLPAQISAASTGFPGGNGNAIALSALSSSPQIGGQSFAEYYGTWAAGGGRQIANAREARDTQKLVASQARALREQASGVSLDSEAASLLQFQRAYQATAQLFKVLNDLTETALSLIR